VIVNYKSEGTSLTALLAGYTNMSSAKAIVISWQLNPNLDLDPNSNLDSNFSPRN